MVNPTMFFNIAVDGEPLGLSPLSSPATIKTNNHPVYTSHSFASFCIKGNIKHIAGILYNPQ
uniref:Uncharacterized protein n=1 Tax=Prolemur simus TaxID=1328070 RepID=A0A8C8YQW2_PROSS